MRVEKTKKGPDLLSPVGLVAIQILRSTIYN